MSLFVPDDFDSDVTPNAPASDVSPSIDVPQDDPYGFSSLTFADLPSQPGDGLFGGVMRHMAANGHPGLQEWAAKDAARRAAALAQEQQNPSACYTAPMTITAYDDHGPGKDWAYWKSHPDGVGPGTVAIANSTPQPYPFGTTFRVRNADGSTAYEGTALDTGAGWDSHHQNVDPQQWIDIWLPNDGAARQWGVQQRDVEICEPPKKAGP